jgi:predicted  nucleic acid-binding Zn-ribbon protein
VANPNTLFFKTDTHHHQEKLKNIFPFILGAENNATFETRRKLALLEAELLEKGRILDAFEKRSATWLNEFKGFFMEGRALGLLPNAPEPTEDWKTEAFVGYLTPLPAEIQNNRVFRIERGAAARLARQVAEIQSREQDLSKEISDRTRKLTRLERLKTSAGGYNEALGTQAIRLSPLGWFSREIEKNHQCPVCRSETPSAVEEVRELSALANSVSESLGAVENASRVLDKERIAIEEEIRKREEELNGVRELLSRIEEQSEEAKDQRQTLKQIYDFGGRLRQELAKYEESQNDSSIRKEIDKLSARAKELRKEIDEGRIRTELKKAIDSVTSIARVYAEVLGVEHFDRPMRLDIENLTLRIAGPSGREDYLWEIGSAANWMGYHLAIILALHEHFLSVRHSPVPQFLFIDQPSQAFFPERLAEERRKRNRTDADPELDLDDALRVERILKALSLAIARTRESLQIVLIEHVGEAAWKGIPNVQIVERWRGDDALVPKDWKPTSH